MTPVRFAVLTASTVLTLDGEATMRGSAKCGRGAASELRIDLADWIDEANEEADERLDAPDEDDDDEDELDDEDDEEAFDGGGLMLRFCCCLLNSSR